MVMFWPAILAAMGMGGGAAAAGAGAAATGAGAAGLLGTTTAAMAPVVGATAAAVPSGLGIAAAHGAAALPKLAAGGGVGPAAGGLAKLKAGVGDYMGKIRSGSPGSGGGSSSTAPSGPATDVPQGDTPASTPLNLHNPIGPPTTENPGLPEFMFLRGLPRMSPAAKGQALAQLYRR